MSQEELNNQQEQAENYQDPIATTEGEPEKKKMGGSTIAATIISIALIKLVGLIGALICYGGYWAVRAIAKSKMSLGARIALGILVGVAFLVLLVVFILFSAVLVSGM